MDVGGPELAGVGGREVLDWAALQKSAAKSRDVVLVGQKERPRLPFVLVQIAEAEGVEFQIGTFTGGTESGRHVRPVSWRMPEGPKRCLVDFEGRRWECWTGGLPPPGKGEPPSRDGPPGGIVDAPSPQGPPPGGSPDPPGGAPPGPGPGRSPSHRRRRATRPVARPIPRRSLRLPPVRGFRRRAASRLQVRLAKTRPSSPRRALRLSLQMVEARNRLNQLRNLQSVKTRIRRMS